MAPASKHYGFDKKWSHLKRREGDCQSDLHFHKTCGPEGRLWYLDEDVVAFDGDRIDLDAGIGNLNGAPGNGIELPAMPWADEPAINDDACAKWTTTMWTHVIEYGKLLIDASDAEFVATTPEFLRCAFSGHFGNRAQANLHKAKIAQAGNTHIC